MIDPVQLPILMKAIDFVFDEGRRILEERRERRRAETNAPALQSPQPLEEKPSVEQETASLAPEHAEEIKKDLISSKIDEVMWRNHEWEVNSLVKQLMDHTRSYYIYKEQYAKWGSALVPPVIVLQLEEKENLIVETIKRLETILSKVYKKDIKLSE